MDARRHAPGDEPHATPDRDDGPPPIMGTWRALYLLVIVELLLVILFCHWLTGRGR